MSLPASASIGHLPTELVLDIVSQLRQKDVKRLVHVSRHYRSIAGPFVYHTQKVSDVEHLVQLKVLASQPEIAHMILYVTPLTPLFFVIYHLICHRSVHRHLDIDAVAMEYWWLGLSRALEEILPKLVNLSSLRLHLAHVLSPSLALALSRLPSLHTLNIKLRNVSLGPHIHVLSNLKHIELDIAPPSTTNTTTNATAFEQVVALVQNSQSTLETLVLHQHAPTCITADGHTRLVEYLRPHPPLNALLQTCTALRSVSVLMEVGNDGTSALAAIDALSGLPITDLSIKCRPGMYPVPPSSGYGMGLEVVQRISQNCGASLRTLKLDDGDVGRANLNRAASGTVVVSLVAF